jgi:peptidoglycan/xylan/chitin deacetylase (PgdA/CDA1 family)
MLDVKKSIIRYGFEALHFSGAHALVRPFVGGLGVVLTLHRVQPESGSAFTPNQSLEITPGFLERMVRRLLRSGIEFISLDEVHRRLTEGDFRRRFVCVTLDDGYRDNKTWAYPILKSHGIPFAIYVATSFPDRLGQLYWVALESMVAANDEIVLEIDGNTRRLPCRSLSEKYETYRTLCRRLHSLSSELEARNVVSDLASRYDIDLAAICDALCLTWEEIVELAGDPLVTIGAHTVNHVILGRNSEAIVRSELQNARSAIEAALGRRVYHLAYPYGDLRAAGPREFTLAAEVGYKTAVTTRPGVLVPEHSERMMSMPRISINGEFQRERYVDVLVSGAGPAIWNGLSRAVASRQVAGSAGSVT